MIVNTDDRDLLVLPSSNGMFVFDLAEEKVCQMKSVSGLPISDSTVEDLIVNYVPDLETLKACIQGSCFLYDPALDAWTPENSAGLTYHIDGYATFLTDGRLWATGGYGGDGLLEGISETMESDGSFKTFFALPQSVARHCIVVVDENRAILSTGIEMRRRYI